MTSHSAIWPLGQVPPCRQFPRSRALVEAQFDTDEALRGSGYGAVQGAVESGADPAEAVLQAITAARELAGDIGLAPEEAAATLAEGRLEAAERA